MSWPLVNTLGEGQLRATVLGEAQVDAREIYENHVEEYDDLVRAEDADGNLLPALRSIADLDGASVVEVGAGTGRLTALMLDAGAHVHATEVAAPMLELARDKLGGNPRLRLSVADARSLPAPDAEADLGIAGWVFGHLRHWLPEDWRTQIGDALDEMARTVRPGGHLVVIETLGTGRTEPQPPNADLAEYFRWMQSERGFVRHVIRTDYAFASVDDAARVLGFFFGPAKAELVRANDWSRVPECTGIWSRRR